MKWSHNKLVIGRVKQADHREVYAGLLWWQDRKGYKFGWVANKFREIFGKWPAPSSPVSPVPPDTDLREYLGIMNTRYRARKKREERKILGRDRALAPDQGTGVADQADVGERRASTAGPAV